MPNLSDAVCTAINAKYRLLAFGREKLVTDLCNEDVVVVCNYTLLYMHPTCSHLT